MKTLEEYFDSLSKWLSSHGVPAWNNVLFSEDLRIDPFNKKSLNQSEFTSLTEFSDRFNELLKEGHNWLNLGALGILNGALIVSVEKPKFNAGSATTSVNQSGPPNCVKDNDYNLENFLEIEK
jgi:hypothetical protein